MKTDILRIHVICFLLISSILTPGFASTDEQKIRVTRSDASIRLRPDHASELIETPTIGKEFEVKNTIGEWYEIEFVSRVGMMIVGYIHKNDVEEPETLKIEPGKAIDIPPVLSHEEEQYKKLVIAAGGVFSFGTVYDHEHAVMFFEDKYFFVTDHYKLDPLLGINLGLGYFFLPNFELTANFIVFFSKNNQGTFRIDVPNPNNPDDYKSDALKTSLSPRNTKFGLGFNYYPLTGNIIKPYAGASGNYIQSKMDLVKSFTFTVTEYPDKRHSTKITDIKYEETILSKFGFALIAGINVELTGNLIFFGEGNYTLAPKVIQYPLYAGEELKVNMGGFIVNFGFKFAF